MRHDQKPLGERFKWAVIALPYVGGASAAILFSSMIYSSAQTTPEEKAEEKKEESTPNLTNFNSGSRRIEIDMQDSNLGDVYVVDAPGEGDFTTLCFMGKRVWAKSHDDEGGFAVTDDPTCEESYDGEAP